MAEGLKLSKRQKVDPNLSNTLGIIYRSLKKWNLSLNHYNQALSKEPQNASFLNNKANVLREIGSLNEAIKYYILAIEANPQNPLYHCNLAKVYNDNLNFKKAEFSAKNAQKLDPLNFEVFNNLGLALEGQNKPHAAETAYTQALSIENKNPQAHTNIGKLYFKIDKLERAVHHTKQAIFFKPEAVEPYYNLCEIYEKTSKLDEFEKTIQIALIATKNNPSILLKKGQLEFRKKNYKKCLSILQGVPLDRLTKAKITVLHELMGKSFDYTEDHSKAFLHFELMNSSATELAATNEISGVGYLNNVVRLRESFEDASYQTRKPRTVKGSLAPTFIIGFPRSGTTLLDTILRSHPMIGVIEEKPIVDTVVANLSDIVDHRSITGLSKNTLDTLKEIYIAELEKLSSNYKSKKVIIDKFPLNLIHAPLINRIFPDAKFILMLRHPCDCVLSCFMQNFELNEAMVNFLDLNTTAKLYSHIMELWSVYSKNINMNLEIVKYEDLIYDLEGTSKRIIKFLDLSWERKMLEFHKTGLARSQIKTPSYNQVTEKLYTHADGRWKNYSTNISHIIKTLEPWIKKFSYTK